MKKHIQKLVAAAVSRLEGLNGRPEIQDIQPDIERARDSQHGDYACNIAMKLAGPLGNSPREIAQSIVDRVPPSDLVKTIEIAGPGFINFRLSPHAFHQVVEQIVQSGARYGCSNMGDGKRVLLEYVSANPTGPLHVGHGRHAAYGASVGNLLKATGHDVRQEYYVNDAGRQMDILTLSVWLRMLGVIGVDTAFPNNAYHGEYVVDIARSATGKFEDCLSVDIEKLFAGLPADGPDAAAEIYLDQLIDRARETLGTEVFTAILRHALDAILEDIKDDLAEFGVAPDEFFSEQNLMDTGAVQRALDRVDRSGKTYEKDGAIWFRATEYGDEKDRVVVRENGRTTYFASDIAYHLYKRERGFDLLLDVLGADHHGYVARVRAGLEAMGEPPESLEVNLVQFVVLYRGKEKIPMSTRTGNFVTLRELRKEVGNDAARLFFVMRSNEQHLDFDLELAKSQSNDNPVYYIQYAHARICSVMNELDTRNYSWSETDGIANLDLLNTKSELALMRALSRYPEIIELAAKQRAPQHLVHYLHDLAQEFHSYYNGHRLIVDDDNLRNARLLLVIATRQVLRNGFELTGVSAPTSM